MTNRREKAKDALDRLAETLIEDLLNASDAEILAEAKEDGQDIAATASQSRKLYERALAVHGKQRMAAARSALNFKNAPRHSSAARFTPKEARQILANTLRTAPETAAKLTIAARKGQELSDADVYGMLDDLADLGLLPPGKNEGST